MSGPEATRPGRVVAFGGGHGLSATLRALRRLGLAPTAVVTVADNGGSSGRLRASRPILPPGDLRQALAALAAEDDTSATNARLMQHRFAGTDDLSGHAVGNLLLLGLFEVLDDPVVALDHAAEMVRATGRVLPMSRLPLSIEAEIRGADPDRPADRVVVRGQHEVAVSTGEVCEVRLVPPEPAACQEAVEAVGGADWLLLGPGSWYTSVIPHLLVPELREAIAKSPARRLVTLNLATESETTGLSAADHLAELGRYLPELRLDVVLADARAVDGDEPLRAAAESLGARLVTAPVAVADGGPRHDPAALAAALGPILGHTKPIPGPADRADMR
ncbi:gluconeogenesis factor YvcK family protein [Actinocatenispora rupis]|uniref:Putative gluconeogenesis factor n=1 Tax=Actinocatenispora rupis TaxID=519421 RepID=A0A8J3N7T0_9ACTN|nr:uridine diphosphate-N-acetylglucosamine-binding protein YvcK [Actinocatenispora rupis]GID09396.1 putative gluconeogenesis factor [Actinocatenispora rupis]